MERHKFRPIRLMAQAVERRSALFDGAAREVLGRNTRLRRLNALSLLFGLLLTHFLLICYPRRPHRPHRALSLVYRVTVCVSVMFPMPRQNWQRPLRRPIIIPKVMTLSTVGGILRGALYWVEI